MEGIERHGLGRYCTIFFQQDGATCHTVTETMQLLQTKFHGCVILRHGDLKKCVYPNVLAGMTFKILHIFTYTTIPIASSLLQINVTVLQNLILSKAT